MSIPVLCDRPRWPNSNTARCWEPSRLCCKDGYAHAASMRMRCCKLTAGGAVNTTTIAASGGRRCYERHRPLLRGSGCAIVRPPALLRVALRQFAASSAVRGSGAAARPALVLRSYGYTRQIGRLTTRLILGTDDPADVVAWPKKYRVANLRT